MNDSFEDGESAIVAHVAEVFTDVQVDTIFGLIRRITKFHTMEDTIDSAVEKISNYLLENNNSSIIIDDDIIEDHFETQNSPDPQVIELNDSFNEEIEEPNLMALARQLAGNGNVKPEVEPDVVSKERNEEIFQWLDKKDVPEPVTNEPVPLTDQPDGPLGQGDAKPKMKPKNKTVTKTKVPKEHKVKRRKKEMPLENIPEDAIPAVAVAEPEIEPQAQAPEVPAPTEPEEANNDKMETSAAGGVGFESKKDDLNIVSTIPDLDRTVTDIDVMFECMCCYNEVPFDYMVQCSEGHLFCCQCLERYAQESVYGHGKGDLKCMTTECSESFPRSQLQRALPADLYKKYEERVSDECLNSANLENFIRCKFCNYGAELDPAQSFFNCPQCAKHFCRKCQELFQDHEGLTCEQVEKDGETKIRTNYEEKMAEAKIRTCPKCKSRFTKESGCNKITCRCGKTMCYICRTPDIHYDHFCQHVRTPNQGCKKCKACFLWSNADEDDRLAIEEIRKEGVKAREREGFTEEKVIGAPKDPEPPARAGAAAAANNIDEAIRAVAERARIEAMEAVRLQRHLQQARRPAPMARRRGVRDRRVAAMAAAVGVDLAHVAQGQAAAPNVAQGQAGAANVPQARAAAPNVIEAQAAVPIVREAQAAVPNVIQGQPEVVNVPQARAAVGNVQREVFIQPRPPRQMVPQIYNPIVPHDGLVANLERNYYQRRAEGMERMPEEIIDEMPIRERLERDRLNLDFIRQGQMQMRRIEANRNAALLRRARALELQLHMRERAVPHPALYNRALDLNRDVHRDPRPRRPAPGALNLANPQQRQEIDLNVPPFAANAQVPNDRPAVNNLDQNDAGPVIVDVVQEGPGPVNNLPRNAAAANNNANAQDGDNIAVKKETKAILDNLVTRLEAALQNGQIELAKKITKGMKIILDTMK